MTVATSSLRDTASEFATGAELTGNTVTLTVPVAVPPLPSLRVYWKLSGPT
ncbi:hypothetical protein D3C87_2100360 [compost metagenome]